MQTDDLHCFNYVACDIPPGMTIEAWKRERAHETRRGVHTRRRGLFGFLHRAR